MKNLILLVGLTLAQFIFAQNYPETLPDFKIFSIEGKDFSKNEVAKYSYSYFIYFNPECGHCQTAFKKLNKNAEELKNADVMLYPVSSNTQEKTQKFFEKYAPKIKDLENMTVLKDDNFKFADALFVGGYPTSYLYDKNQKLITVYNGAGKILEFLEVLK